MFQVTIFTEEAFVPEHNDMILRHPGVEFQANVFKNKYGYQSELMAEDLSDIFKVLMEMSQDDMEGAWLLLNGSHITTH